MYIHYKWYCICYSGCNQDVPDFTIENEQQVWRVSSYMYFKFGQASMNWKKAYYVQKCMQWRKWRNWRKIASLWRFELDAKSGPLEAGDFGEIGNFGKNRQRAGDNSDKNTPDPWRLAFLAKMAIVAKLAILAKIARNVCNGENGKKLPAYGDLNSMPKVAPWRLAILAKMGILAKLAILAKIARGLAISRMWQNI